MLKDIIEVTPLAGYRLRLRFEDGVGGEVNLETIIKFEGVFAPLRERVFFEQVSIHSELGTICWPNGADLDADVLYAQITGKKLPVATANK